MKNINWAYVVGGILLILGSILAFTHPLDTFITLAVMFGVITIARGIMLILDYNKLRKLSYSRANFALVLAVFLIILGIIFLVSPTLSAVVLTVAVAIWFILDAIHGLANAEIYKGISNWLYPLGIVLNILLLIFGIILLFNPIITLLSIAFLVGCALMIVGLIYLVYGFTGQSERI